MVEEWRTIKDFPDYDISNRGRVRRNVDSHNNRKAGFLLKVTLGLRRYNSVTLYVGDNPKVRMVHSLVLKAFIGPRPYGHQGNHINGIRTDNRPENLEWVTPSENIRHAHRIGLARGRRGEESPMSKLKEGEVWLIRKLLYHGVFQRVIALMFKIDRANVAYIKSGKTWRHVKYEGGPVFKTAGIGVGSRKKRRDTLIWDRNGRL